MKNQAVLIEQLTLLNNKIFEVLKTYEMSEASIKENANKFSKLDRDKLLILLKKKIDIQKQLFELQGGDLSNVKFFSEYK